MKITYKNAVKQTKKFQQGGSVGAPAEGAEAPVSQEEAPEEPAPEEEGQENPMMQ